jgi:hypothetical protein
VQVGTWTAEIPKFNIGWSTTWWTTVASWAGFTPSLAASSYWVESWTYDYNMKVSQWVSSCIE